MNVLPFNFYIFRYGNKGVVGFDIAGPEFGFSPSLFDEAYKIAKKAGLGFHFSC